ncbi:hypothetical protein MROS_2303 [Melioribacter roseus P3M-2]|uniref:Arginyl tRNA synthetase N-terminal domain-containing protein n=1 Tax=Melioribacter roseus (strain DSM 23840 / JCM 17771 / VKM B-2668 / P3M-2) TaxID=1191523 RepID=I7A2V2_MELRP|nr:hypothetical protein MROS_2303 [Melioribacter roseus P3M-2]
MRNYLYSLFDKAARKLDYLKDVNIIFTVPQQESHGDFSTNIAMLLSRKLKKIQGKSPPKFYPRWKSIRVYLKRLKLREPVLSISSLQRIM